MNRLFMAFGDLFGGKKQESIPPTPQIKVTDFSQAHVLQARMREENMTHGKTVQADLSPIRVDVDHGEPVMYFCPMNKLRVKNVICEGDGGVIPGKATAQGFNLPNGLKSGFYKLKNVELTSNGTIQMKATKETKWELADY